MTARGFERGASEGAKKTIAPEELVK